MTVDIMSNTTDCIADPSVYENLNYPAWSEEGYEIAIQLYDGK